MRGSQWIHLYSPDGIWDRLTFWYYSCSNICESDCTKGVILHYSFGCDQCCLLLPGYNSLSLGIFFKKSYENIGYNFMCSISFIFPLSKYINMHTFIHNYIHMYIYYFYVAFILECIVKPCIFANHFSCYGIPAQRTFGIFSKCKGTRGTHSHQLNYRYSLNWKDL